MKIDVFTPVTIGAVTCPNRIVMAPMTRSRALADGSQSPMAATYYQQRASGGLLISEASWVHPSGVGYPGTPGIYNKEQVKAWRVVTDAVHQAGGRIFLQLWHVGRISHPSLQPGGAIPISSSAVQPKGQVYTAEGLKPFVTPRALEIAEVKEIIGYFRQGTLNAKEAGFDGVEIHGANGYLPDQFLRDGVNKRSDLYGGSIENRARFHLEITEAACSAWSPDRVAIRISPNGKFNDMSDSNPRETFGYLVRELNKFNLSYLHVIELMQGDDPKTAIPLSYFREIYNGKLMTNGGYTLDRAQSVIQAGQADLIAFGVPYLANPDLVERFKRGATLNTPDTATFYGGGEKGYLDYPVL